MALNLKRGRDLLKQKLSQNPELMKQIGLSNMQELSNMDDHRLEMLLTPKNLGLLAINKKDLEV